jgi:hypothetical protein
VSIAGARQSALPPGRSSHPLVDTLIPCQADARLCGLRASQFEGLRNAAVFLNPYGYAFQLETQLLAVASTPAAR